MTASTASASTTKPAAKSASRRAIRAMAVLLVFARSRVRREQPRVSRAQRLAAAALQDLAVRHDHPVEVPGEDALEAGARRGAVADQQRVELGRAEAPV